MGGASRVTVVMVEGGVPFCVSGGSLRDSSPLLYHSKQEKGTTPGSFVSRRNTDHETGPVSTFQVSIPGPKTYRHLLRTNPSGGSA